MFRSERTELTLTQMILQVKDSDKRLEELERAFKAAALKTANQRFKLKQEQFKSRLTSPSL